jgi:ATP-dependent DNA helicase DinG
MSDARVAPDAARALRAAIEDVGGDEVFAIGDVQNGQIVSVEVTCRGTPDQVPALLQRPRAGQVVIHNHPSGNLQPSDADLQLAGRYGEDGVGVVIVDNRVERSRWVVEPHVRQSVAVSEAEVAAVFLEAFPRVMPGHEPRRAQVEMAKQVVRALNEEHVAVLEAGTGTGKSLAYLVPAALWAKANTGKVVVATHTLTLQGQLASSDLPMLKKAGIDVPWATLRGRSNYICRRKLVEASVEAGVDPSPLLGGQARAYEPTEDSDDSPDFDATARRSMLTSLVQAASRGEGHRQALQFSVDGDVWEDVRSDHDQTLRARCPHFNDCFYYQARRKAADASLLVVNHHLVLADLSIKSDSGGDGILPKFDRLVLDEGHHLEDAATSLLRDQLTARSVTRALARLVGTKNRKGSLHKLYRRFGGKTSPLDEHEREQFARTSGALIAMVPKVRAQTEATLEGIASALLADHDAPRRVTPELRQDDLWASTIEPALADLAIALGQCARMMDRLGDLLDGLPPGERLAEPQPVFELTRVHRLLGGHARLCGEFTQIPTEQTEPVVRWFERARSRKGPLSAALVGAPLEVGPILRRTVFDPLKSTVTTSATLAVRGSFDHYRSRVGLAPPEQPAPVDREDVVLDAILEGYTADPGVEPEVQTHIFPSPFDYGSQAMLGLPRDLPAPDAPDWAETIARATTAALHVARGGAFVLCTSFAMVDRLHAHASQKLGNRMLLLRQGEMGRSRLLTRFRDAGDAVLFGTDSFWEGVSVKGDALRLVVIPRLPFRVPTEPIQQARSELLQARGQDPFRAHMLPEAVLKLRQGFGRLVRTRSDRGAVLILDRRIIDRWYGRVFLSSLPPARKATGPTRAVLGTIRDFLREPPPSR